MNWLLTPIVWLGRRAASLAESLARKASSAARGIAQRMPWRSRKYRYVVTEEIPDALRTGKVYIAGEGDNVWVASMICPCGCKEVIELNLLPQARPRWEVSRHQDGTVSLSPSIWRKRGCQSHFWLRDGEVTWCR